MCRCPAAEERNYLCVLRDLPPTAKARSMLTEPQDEQRSDKGRHRGEGFLGPPAIWLRAGLFLQILTTAVGVVGSHKLPLPRLPKHGGWKSLLAPDGACLPDNLRIKRFFSYSIWKEHMLSDNHYSLRDSRKLKAKPSKGFYAIFRFITAS